MINYSRKASGYGVVGVQLSNSSIPCSSPPLEGGVVARYVSVCDTWGLINMDEAKGVVWRRVKVLFQEWSWSFQQLLSLEYRLGWKRPWGN
ncbi:hypothetical protein CDAR_236491 [Caerostris darwini]|uniref:Uncharacterized protein n=1 Tax=Caerostris darwini TaxID=1538125 RepID=A0AAV4T6H9_9ARAC|nr:hypothetical protein CDAR_236491 [Caerostris darwini]